MTTPPSSAAPAVFFTPDSSSFLTLSPLASSRSSPQSGKVVVVKNSPGLLGKGISNPSSTPPIYPLGIPKITHETGKLAHRRVTSCPGGGAPPASQDPSPPVSTVIPQTHTPPTYHLATPVTTLGMGQTPFSSAGRAESHFSCIEMIRMIFDCCRACCGCSKRS